MSFLKRSFVTSLTLLLFLVPLVLRGARPAQAEPDPVKVTVTVLRFIQVEDPDPRPLQRAGDYYAKVRIDGFDFEKTGHKDDKADITPHWPFTREVDDSVDPIEVEIQIWDHDTNPDDIIDLNPVDGVQSLTLLVDPATGDWTGDVPDNQRFSEGDGDHEHFGRDEEGEAGRVFFDINVNSDGDIDDDGIPDNVERFGVLDANGNVIADMASLGTDPCRKTIAVEVDYMTGAADRHTHKPKAVTITELTDAFNAAPVPAVDGADCPYSGFPTQSSGVNLIIDVDDDIPEKKATGLGKLGNIRKDNFEEARRPYFHYSLFVHDSKKGSSRSGVCCRNKKDFIVSLGSWKNQTGTARQQAGTFMHELGHSLSLKHGGGDGKNCKPNYLSVMSYTFQTVGITNADTLTTQVNYSEEALDRLDESALDESVGINDGPLVTAWSANGEDWLPSSGKNGRGDKPLDWDDDGNVPEAGTVSVNVNKTPKSGCGGGGKKLDGFDDWENLKFRAIMAPGADAPTPDPHDEITFEQARHIEAFWEGYILVESRADQNTAEGQNSSFELATFVDPGVAPDTHTATVDWGDGTAEAATVDSDGFAGSVTDSHIYADDGTYTVTVKVCDGDGDCASDTLSVTVNNVNPTAEFNASSPVNEGNLISLSLVNPFDPSNTDTAAGFTYAFDCGDGSGYGPFGSSSNTNCPTTDDGTRTVRGKIRDKDEGETEYTAEVIISNVAPTITAVTNNGPIDEGDSATITVTATDPAGVSDPLSYEFDCDGDGSYEIGPQADSSATCTFGDNGDFRVDVRVKDGDGGEDTDFTIVTVSNAPPEVDPPSVSPEPSDEGSPVIASATFSDPGANDAPFTCTVNYSDGSADQPGIVSDNTCTGPAHTYADNGTYPVTIAVTDKDGGTGSSPPTHHVVNNVAPIVDAGPDQTVFRNEVVALSGTWTDPAGSLDDPYNWSWDLDGDNTSDSNGTASFGDVIVETTSFTLEGLYILTFEVTDKDGGAGSDSLVIEVLNQAPDCSNASPSIDTLWPPEHQFVMVNVLGVTDPEGDSLTITIDSIFQDEPVDTTGDGSFTPDGKGVGTDTAEVRAERVGSGNGRVYHISFSADDGHGGSCLGEVLVGVPKNQSQKGAPIDDGQLYDSTAP